jgi:hypothetical protein
MNNQQPVNGEEKKNVAAQNPTPKVEKNNASMPGIENIMAEESINLIPTLSKEEIVVAEKKKKLNVGSITSLLILVIVSILIVGFNIVSRLTLNKEKEDLKTYEAKITQMSQKMISSNEITGRIQLYDRVLGETYSPKNVVDYINAIASKSGTAVVNKFSLGQDLTFTIDGSASDLENVSKFWYLLSNDPKMETVTLQTVGNGTDSARFTFKGKLIVKEFLSSTK